MNWKTPVAVFIGYLIGGVSMWWWREWDDRPRWQRVTVSCGNVEAMWWVRCMGPGEAEPARRQHEPPYDGFPLPRVDDCPESCR